MKKNSIITLFFLIVGISGLSAANTAGVYATPTGASATVSMDRVEVELYLNGLFNSQLGLSADYTVIGNDFAISTANGFFWNVAVGPSLSISSGSFGVGIIFPVEFGYNIPGILNGLDVYIQAKPFINILPSLSPDFEIGLGLRVRL